MTLVAQGLISNAEVLPCCHTGR